MSGTPSFSLANPPLAFLLVLLCSILALALPAVAQDQGINRYTLYTGFDWMNNPGLNLTQRRSDIDFGVTVKPWLAIGGDFSAAGDAVFSGGGTINGADTVYAPKIDGAPFPGVPPPAQSTFPSTPPATPSPLHQRCRLNGTTLRGGPAHASGISAGPDWLGTRYRLCRP